MATVVEDHVVGEAGFVPIVTDTGSENAESPCELDAQTLKNHSFPDSRPTINAREFSTV